MAVDDDVEVVITGDKYYQKFKSLKFLIRE